MFDVLAVELPKAFQFLQPGWLILHFVAIPTIFLIGLAVGRRQSTSSGTTGYPGAYPS